MFYTLLKVTSLEGVFHVITSSLHVGVITLSLLLPKLLGF